MPRAREKDAGDGATAIDATAAKWFALRDRGLRPEQERELARWLAEDPRHADALGQLDAAWSTFGKPVRAGEADQLLAELAGRRTCRRRTRLQAFAAALVLALGGFTVLSWRGEAGRAEAPPLAVVHSPRQQTLSDGSKVTLRDGAGIAVEFTASQRRVRLESGEALFEVEKDNARPFIVVANGVAVRAVGTAFSVQSAPGAVDVLVTEGVVSVGAATDAAVATTVSRTAHGKETDATPPAILVSAGHRMTVDPASDVRPSQSEAVLPAEIERRLSWRAPRVEFAGLPLAEAVALLNREAAGRTATRLHIADPRLNAERVSGVFRTDNLDAFLFLMETGFGLTVTRTGETVVLSRPAPPGERSE